MSPVRTDSETLPAGRAISCSPDGRSCAPQSPKMQELWSRREVDNAAEVPVPTEAGRKPSGPDRSEG